MRIEIIGTEVTDEQGLGPCYRITQRTDLGIELYLLPRSAIAADLELYGVDDPLLVLDWRLHGYRGEPLPPGTIEASLYTAAEAQQARVFALYARAHLGNAVAGSETEISDDLRAKMTQEIDLAEQDVEDLTAKARRMRADEIDAIRATVTIVDDLGLAELRTLVLTDAKHIDADRDRVRQQLAPSIHTAT
ncbi:hypothetical protein [Lentzea flava]|uniref:Uncharacterized protein n=1 Tax=Lentzea flava TaxID=103732 RepID=A0ABQ2VFY1_9PSEU|nr:hypothetical protein [Lentzea flava]MCP2205263.1 hypothetical protein [Lentzea flava]GGU84950.1 hypothetical protein GCM10010178_89030 [Lentzea flava]